MENREILDQQYTFETFKVTKENKLVYEVATYICDNLGTAYNPLYIYGATNTGKTHLLKAIKNKVVEDNKNINVLYESTETLENKFKLALKNNEIETFRNNYKMLDVLLLDDIQQMYGKESLQDEFLQIFHLLYPERKQIVVSSKYSLEDVNIKFDLKRRLDYGLQADISEPIKREDN